MLRKYPVRWALCVVLALGACATIIVPLVLMKKEPHKAAPSERGASSAPKPSKAAGEATQACTIVANQYNARPPQTTVLDTLYSAARKGNRFACIFQLGAAGGAVRVLRFGKVETAACKGLAA